MRHVKKSEWTEQIAILVSILQFPWPKPFPSSHSPDFIEFHVDLINFISQLETLKYCTERTNSDLEVRRGEVNHLKKEIKAKEEKLVKLSVFKKNHVNRKIDMSFHASKNYLKRSFTIVLSMHFIRLNSVKRNVEEAKEALDRTLDNTLSAEERAVAADEFLDKEEMWVREIAKEIRRLREQQVKIAL